MIEWLWISFVYQSIDHQIFIEIMIFDWLTVYWMIISDLNYDSHLDRDWRDEIKMHGLIEKCKILSIFFCSNNSRSWINVLSIFSLFLEVPMTSGPTNELEFQLFRLLQRANLLSYYDSFIQNGKQIIWLTYNEFTVCGLEFLDSQAIVSF